MRRVLMLAAVLVAAACIVPSTASAWTPEECQAWYDQYGTVHPDCQPPPPEVTVCRNGETVTIPETDVQEGDVPGECVVPQVQVCVNGETQTVPEDEQPEGSTPGACQPPPTPPSVTPPPPTPPTDVPPEEKPPVTRDQPPVEQPPANKEQPKGGEVQGEEEQTPESPPTEVNDTGSTLPFTGTPIALWIEVLLGGGILAAGFAARRLTRD